MDDAEFYADAIRRKLREDTETIFNLSRVVKVLAPLEAVCTRSRCFDSERCAHLRIDVLYIGRSPGRGDRAFTATFGPGEDPGPPEIKEGWA